MLEEKTGVLLCGHGSRDPDAVGQLVTLTRRLDARFTDTPVTHGFLEFATPVISDALDTLRTAGVTRVLAAPIMLFAAGHVKNDIPSVLNTYGAQHPEMTIQYGRDLGLDIRMVRAAGARIVEAIDGADAAGPTVARQDTLLMVVGRGTSDPDANSNVAKVSRNLCEGLGFGWGETGYSGVTFPLTAPALRHAARLGYKRIVVFPYFLFTGVLVKRIYEHTDMVAAEHPEIEFVKAGYLNDHPDVVDALVTRISGAEGDDRNMNCQVCKYRTQVLGFEDEVGLAQQSHHHHVEGIGVGDGQGHGHGPDGPDDHEPHDHGPHDHAGDSHGHDHNHGHHPYPHAGHRHGPESMQDSTRRRT